MQQSLKFQLRLAILYANKCCDALYTLFRREWYYFLFRERNHDAERRTKMKLHLEEDLTNLSSQRAILVMRSSQDTPDGIC
ncbi:hypothetical protein TNCT_548481 [Trichonephila clavata]|uniref:Uncharacterized protein n=1 Tax=Trichonephila clavata TaxID=2740835 RepID=A0A8X6J5C2_TRICU|nr:hypothetical protein TNCT_548481 [Trichonephila clavata]